MDSVWKLYWWLTKGQSFKERIKTFFWFYNACCAAKFVSRDRDTQHLLEEGEKLLIVPLGRDSACGVVAGPYAKYNDYRVGICLAPEVIANTGLHYDWIVAWPDFGIPDEYEIKQALVVAALHLKRQNPVYVGCLGGIGRTGTFLALLCKMGGEPYPVAYVRKHYLSIAVETDQQMKFIGAFDVVGLA